MFRYRERMDDKLFLLAPGLVAAIGIVVTAGPILKIENALHQRPVGEEKREADPELPYGGNSPDAVPTLLGKSSLQGGIRFRPCHHYLRSCEKPSTGELGS